MRRSAIARALAPLTETHPASEQVACLLAFWSAHARPIADDDPFASRERRARAAIVDMLPSLAAVHAAHDDPEWTIDDLGIAVRRVDRGSDVRARADDGSGVHLLDDQAARYGDFDDVTIVGVVDQDWPERPRRNIFYPPALLKSLGWPSEKDRRAAADARFLDLLTSASPPDDGVHLHARRRRASSRGRCSSTRFLAPGCRRWRASRSSDARVFADEALSLEPVAFEPFKATRGAGPSCGRRVRRPMRPSSTAPSATLPARAWSVSAIETYLDCPFKFFAQHVLKLEEEPDDEEVMDPRRQGQFVHEVFERSSPRGSRPAIAPSRRRISTRRARCSPRSSIARSNGCPTPRPVSSARGCSDRRPQPGWARRCFAWKPNARSPSSNACSSTR